jgi:WD40 repeat protein
MPERGGKAGYRRALCIGMSTFRRAATAETGGEPETDAYADLPFAAARVADLAGALAGMGYECVTADEKTLPTAAELGAAVAGAVAGGSDGDTQVVHVLSHGHLAPSGAYVLGADGQRSTATDVAGWVRQLEDFADQPRPRTLFLIDTCHAGAAARLDWLRAADADSRAWVIAATRGDEDAYAGRFSQAVANVLRRIARGDIDFYPSEYVQFGHLVEEVRTEVARLGGRQLVTGTPVDGLAAPPFFPNRRPPGDQALAEARGTVDEAVAVFADLEQGLDPAHFLDRASGRGAAARLVEGCFSGRDEELAALTAWVDGRAAGAVRVVTGGEGSGKSAVLGMVVCAAHPNLRAATEALRSGVADSLLPRAADHFVAVHLRERNLSQTLTALATQLRLDVAGLAPEPAAVVAAIRTLPVPPTVVVDALDEAAAQVSILEQLLLPLLRAQRPDGGPACRLLVGMRPWAEFAELRREAEQDGGLLDLDTVPVDRLRRELDQYVRELLSLAPGWAPGELVGARRAVARTVASALTEPSRRRGGEFLAAGLYINWLISTHPTGVHGAEAAALSAGIPRTVPEILELDLGTRVEHRWLRPVLTAVAQARGAGLPASLIRQLAPLFRSDRRATPLGLADFDEALWQVRFYLRSSPDANGHSLYRLFHQGLVDHLRGNGAAAEVLDRLREAVPVDPSGQRRWDATERYLLRHLAEHAAEAGQLDELIEDSGFLVHADPSLLEPFLDDARSTASRLHAAAYRASFERHRRSSAAIRRDLLAFDAVRLGAYQLRDRLRRVAGLAPQTWWPRWSSGTQLSTALRATMYHSAGVSAVAATTVDGQPVVAAADVDGALRLWDVEAGQPVGGVLAHDRAVYAVSSGELDGRQVAVTGDADGVVRIWDIGTGTVARPPITGHDGAIRTIMCLRQGGRLVALTAGDDRTIRAWDLAAPAIPARSAQPRRAGTTSALTTAVVDGLQLVLSGHSDGVVQLGLLSAGAYTALNQLSTGHAAIRAVCCTAVGGRQVLAAGAADGRVRTWDLATWEPLLSFRAAREAVLAITALWLEDQALLATGAADGALQLWDATDGQPASDPLAGHAGAVRAALVLPVRGRPALVTGGADGTVRRWQPSTARPLGRPLFGHTGTVCAITSVPVRGQLAVVTGGADGTVRVWDRATGEQLCSPLAPAEAVGRGGTVALATTILAGVPLAVAGSAAGTLRVWDLDAAAEVGRSLRRPPAGILAVATASLDDRPVAAVGGSDGAVAVWDLGTRRLVGRPFTVSPRPVRAITCIADDTAPIVVTGDTGGHIQTHYLGTGQPTGRPPLRHPGITVALAWSPVDGRPLLVAAGSDGMIRIWNLDAGELVGAFRVTRTAIPLSVACGHIDGRPVVTTGDTGGMVRIWDLRTLDQLAEIAVPGQVRIAILPGTADLALGYGWETACLSRGDAAASLETGR